MKPVTRHVAATAAVLAGGAAVALAAFVGSGAYDIGADAPHTAAVASLLEALRERSIETRAQRVAVPADFGDDARVVRGAGNYDAMCAACHLAPGSGATELSRGLYPQPPELAKERTPPAQAFWIVKHGIKASGMPAWGPSMGDGHVWDLVAFLQKLPALDGAAYRALVERSGGHSHGGGESGAGADHHGGGEAAAGADHHGGAPHGPGAASDGHGAGGAAGTAAAGTAGTAAGTAHGHGESGGPAPAPGRVHVHADGRQHEHGAPRAASGVPRR